MSLWAERYIYSYELMQFQCKSDLVLKGVGKTEIVKYIFSITKGRIYIYHEKSIQLGTQTKQIW